MGTLGWQGLYNFLRTHGLTPLSDAFVTLIMVSWSKFTFSEKGAHPHLWSKTWEAKNSKCENNSKKGPRRSKIMRGFRMWPQNLNRTTFDPIFGPKPAKNWQNTRFNHFWHFCAKRGSNVVRFEIWGQICNPSIMKHLLDTHLLLFSHFEFLASHVIWPQMRARACIFRNVNCKIL